MAIPHLWYEKSRCSVIRRSAFVSLGLALAFGTLSPLGATPGPAKAAATSRDSFVNVSGGTLYYQECGSAPQNVVLIHDGVVDSAVWDDVWPEFCKHFHTVRYDRRGFGRSPAATSWYSELDDLAAVLRATKINRTALVGSSHGGQLSIDFTLSHPTSVQQLILVGPVLSGMPYTEHFLDRGNKAFTLLQKGDLKAAITEWSNDRYLIAPENTAARHRLLELLLRAPQDMSHEDRILATKPAIGRLREITIPTLIITGDADIPDVHAHSGAIEAGIPAARRIVMSGVGHILYLERPVEFCKLAIDFLESGGKQ
jgi:3-oxoadipate enol-lactonase